MFLTKNHFREIIMFRKGIMRQLLILIVLIYMGGTVMADDKKIVIAHRGASGYLPEHSLEAKAMAYAMGADYLEQDVVMTKDDRLVVLHDHYLDRVTNVAQVFPKRKRKDGRYYVIDFTLAEIKSLKMTEGFKIKDGKAVQNFPQRFPIWKSIFRVSTLEEELELIQGLNKSTGHNVGIYPEIKSPAFHRAEGKDISVAVLKVLKKYGYSSKNDKIYLQCFNPEELRRIHDELFPKLKMEVNLVQLLPKIIYHKKRDYTEYSPDSLSATLKEIAEYADGIGPSKSMIVLDGSTREKLILSDMVKEAHKLGMVVHPYTFRLDHGKIPPYAASFEDMLDLFYFRIGIDGAFTDFPDRAVNFLRRAEYQREGL